jgi:hypothetical protein
MMRQKPIIRAKSKERISPEQVADKIKKIAKNIREVSSTTRDTVKKFHDSGAILDIGEAVQEAATAGRDTAAEIRDTAKEIRDSHVAADTASAVEQTAKIAGETVEVVEDTTKQVPMAAPKTTSTVIKGTIKAHRAAKPALRQVERKVKKTSGKAKDETRKLAKKAETAL